MQGLWGSEAMPITQTQEKEMEVAEIWMFRWVTRERKNVRKTGETVKMERIDRIGK